MMHSSSPRLLTIGAVCIYLFLYAPLLRLDRVFPDAVGIQCALGGIHHAFGLPGRLAEPAHSGGAAREPDGDYSSRVIATVMAP